MVKELILARRFQQKTVVVRCSLCCNRSHLFPMPLWMSICALLYLFCCNWRVFKIIPTTDEDVAKLLTTDSGLLIILNIFHHVVSHRYLWYMSIFLVIWNWVIIEWQKIVLYILKDRHWVACGCIEATRWIDWELVGWTKINIRFCFVMWI